MGRSIGLFVAFFFISLNITAQQLPLEAFASLPDVQHVSLSPDGRYLASSIRVDVEDIKGRAVSIVDLETGEQKLPLMAKNETYFITWMNWASDNKLLVGAMYPDIATDHPFTNLATRPRKVRKSTLFSINAETEKVQPVLSSRFLSNLKVQPVNGDNVISTLPDDPDNILMQVGGNMGWPQVHKVNLTNQETRTIQPSEIRVMHWGTDQQNRVRLKQQIKDAVVTLSVREIDGDSWRDLWTYEVFSGETVEPLGFGKDPNDLYILAYHEGYKAAFKVDLASDSLETELVYANPNYDVNGSLIYSHKTGEVIGITHTEGQGFVFWDQDYKNFQASIDKALPNTTNHIVSFSDDESKYLVHASSSIDSGTYFLGDRDKGSLKAAAYSYKHLEPGLMSPKKSYNYQARDGMEIRGFLTLPKDREAKKLPTLVFPHGGPISSSDNGFNYWTQLFANRGYAVLEMNFRGSSGQGLNLMQAGLKNWGQEMQDDVQDGALKLIEEGIADPDRVCIVGASYGGYAALMGAAKTPDFYRCAASFAGVSDINQLLRRYRSRHAKKNIVDLQVGDDKATLREVSPLYNAEKIKVPVLLVHGDQDRQVPPEHSREMHEALEKAGKEVTYIELEAANHFLTNNDDRVATLRAFEEFLAEHLQPAQ